MAFVNSRASKHVSSVPRMSAKTKLRITNPARFCAQLHVILAFRLRAAGNRVSAETLHQANVCEHQVKVQVNAVGVHRASRSEPLDRGAHRSGGIPPLLCRQPRRGGFGGTPRGKPSCFCLQIQARHNPSLNHRTRYGRPPGPGWWYAVHFHQPGPSVLPQRSG